MVVCGRDKVVVDSKQALSQHESKNDGKEWNCQPGAPGSKCGHIRNAQSERGSASSSSSASKEVIHASKPSTGLSKYSIC